MTRRRRRTRPASPGLAVALLRVSTDERRQELGAEAQRAAIAAWEAREGVQVVAWHLDEASGGAPLDKRPGLVAALADVEAHGAGRLVVHRIDRLTRDPIVAALAERELERLGAQVAVVEGAGGGNDPTAQLVRGILVAVGQFERQMIRARIKAALAVKQARGEMTGKAPFGQRLAPDGVHLEPDPGEQAVIAQAVELSAAGGTVRGIAAELTRRGVVGRAGRPLTHDAVHKILVGHRPAENGAEA